MSNSESSEGEVLEPETEAQVVFVRLLKDNRVVLNKSQLPGMKAKKAAAITNIIEAVYKRTGQRLDEKQVMKKINNMKSKVKMKSDATRTGNKQIKLAQWEQLFLDILNEQDNPTVTLIKGAREAGFPAVTSDFSQRGSRESSVGSLGASTNPPPPLQEPPTKTTKRSAAALFDEEEETRRLSTGELQRLCLLEQLKLTRLQIEYYQNKMKKTATDMAPTYELQDKTYAML
uniref:N-acetylmuramic acid 6-phosphate etherase n=1 Tax=Lygus hesperus TaxID=30085 RepID=A0A0A9X6D2_LYGHE